MPHHRIQLLFAFDGFQEAVEDCPLIGSVVEAASRFEMVPCRLAASEGVFQRLPECIPYSLRDIHDYAELFTNGHVCASENEMDFNI